ncbi:hypothetical protein DNH61_00370 [Paenibacillus sambharensis]|uniref:Uncharacterized protein n=1 Tax=Paenibacillus sambharensis TaxID=1803190 RepID=A0A2W1LSK9_9BACL|nr:hypothetical protein DNH61_00370 [Paenibacillus sambharensis]
MIKDLKIINRGEKYLDPLLEYLDAIQAVIIFIPERLYKELTAKASEILTSRYFPNGLFEMDGIAYASFQSVNNLV